MKRRQLLIDVGDRSEVRSPSDANAVSGGAVEREMTVTVTDDGGAALAFRETGLSDGAPADATEDPLHFESRGDEGEASADDVYVFDETFRVVNHGTRQLYVWTDVVSEAFDDGELYVFRGDRSTPFDAGQAVTVAPDDSRSLGVYVDAGDETGTFSADVTVYASSDPPTEKGGGSRDGGDGVDFDDEPTALGLDLDVTESYEVAVVAVTDGDTVDVEFDDGTVESVRIIGLDSPETDTRYERPAEWEGIDERDTLVSWGEEATAVTESALGSATVTLSFDEDEGLRGHYGRLLGFLEVDGDLFNERLIREGYARVYDSGLGRHDEFWSAEAAARANDRGLWSDSDVAATPPVRNDPVDKLFFPAPAAVETATGGIDDDRVPVRSENDEPLVGVDRDARVAMVGGPLVDETFHSAEDGPGVEPYGNEVFLTNLLDGLAADGRDGDVLVDGGHGQFATSYALSAEDAAYYLRYLEGQGIGFEGVNDLADEYGPSLSDARALIVTAPDASFDDAEVDAISAFTEDGAAVVLATTGAEGADAARKNLDALADALGSDLRTGASVTDESNNLGGPENPATTNFDASDELFRPFGADGEGG